MSIVIAFANMKGGVGKTTLCVNLAYQIFQEQEKRVLVVDNDPQFNATSALLAPKIYLEKCIKPPQANKTTYNIYEKPPRIAGKRKHSLNPKEFFLTTWYFRGREQETQPVLDLIASRIELYETLRNPSQKEYLLDSFLKKNASTYDYIFIDCPPTPSVLTASAFAASDFVLIPVTPDYYATLGLPQFLGTLSDFKEDLVDSHGVTPLGVVFTNVELEMSAETIESMDRVKAVLSSYSKDLRSFKAVMYHYKVYQKTIWQSRPVQKISGPGTRGKSAASADLRAIADELGANIRLVQDKTKKGELP